MESMRWRQSHDSHGNDNADAEKERYQHVTCTSVNALPAGICHMAMHQAGIALCRGGHGAS